MDREPSGSLPALASLKARGPSLPPPADRREHRPAGRRQLPHLEPEAGLDPRGVGNFVVAQAKGVRLAGRALLRGSLRMRRDSERERCKGAGRGDQARSHVVVLHIAGSAQKEETQAQPPGSVRVALALAAKRP
jgi:hypothetical protein